MAVRRFRNFAPCTLSAGHTSCPYYTAASQHFGLLSVCAEPAVNTCTLITSHLPAISYVTFSPLTPQVPSNCSLKATFRARLEGTFTPTHTPNVALLDHRKNSVLYLHIIAFLNPYPANVQNMVSSYQSCGPRKLSRYSDSLQAARSGDRNPVGAKFSAPVQTGPGAYPASCTMGTGSFPGVKRPGRGAEPLPLSKC